MAADFADGESLTFRFGIARDEHNRLRFFVANDHFTVAFCADNHHSPTPVNSDSHCAENSHH
jgi:hypothetical protein